MKHAFKKPLTYLVIGIIGSIIGLYIDSSIVMFFFSIVQFISVIANTADIDISSVIREEEGGKIIQLGTHG